ncbi:MAG: SipW-dependent-type signal peptide-containing protein [Oscillospiraceae bacterium]
MKKKTVAIILAVVLVCVGAVGGTLAWLNDHKGVENTFTVGDINIEIAQPKFDVNNAKLVPGTSILGDPTVTVKKDSEAAYALVMVENNLKANDKIIGEPNISADWIAVATQGNKTIYKYNKTISSSKIDTVLTPVFTEIRIDGSITAADMEGMEIVKSKTVVITAYAHQVIGQTEEQAADSFKTLLQGTWVPA